MASPPTSPRPTTRSRNPTLSSKSSSVRIDMSAARGPTTTNGAPSMPARRSGSLNAHSSTPTSPARGSTRTSASHSRSSYDAAAWDSPEEDYWEDPDTPTVEAQSRSKSSKGKLRLDDGDDDAAMPLRPMAVARGGAGAGRRKRARARDGAMGSGAGGSSALHSLTSLLDKVRRRPLLIFAFLVSFGVFAWGLNRFLRWYLNPDKEPLPWRTYCQEQSPFPHAYADALAPVDVLVGVLTTVDTFERRSIIRQTMNSHTLPLDAATGQPMGNVQVKFILGRPSKNAARKVALEAEAFNDIVVLDMDDTGSARKTLNFFRWASVNATVPVKVPVEGEKGKFRVAWKMVDYVVKSDDDTFIMLDELERHLRVTPRRMTYWGYLVKNWFMSGEAYALSSDLVRWLSTSPEVEATAYGKEDTRTPRWLAMHPDRDLINWRSERCWIYDHPRANTPYSHGFLFPDEVERIKLEGKLGLTSQQMAERGGEHASHWYSSVIRWGETYRPPREGLTAEEEAEALVEGKGRWAESDYRRPPRIGTARQDLVYDSQDARLRPEEVQGEGHPALAHDVSFETESGLFAYGHHAEGEREGEGEGKEESPVPPVEQPITHHLPPKARSPAEAIALARRSDEPVAEGAQPVKPGVGVGVGVRAYQAPHSPASLAQPMHKDEGGEEAELRSRRYLGKPHGGTVIVHYQKTTERWMETALVFLGKRALWSRNGGANGPSREWRMYGSPGARGNGFVSEGL